MYAVKYEDLVFAVTRTPDQYRAKLRACFQKRNPQFNKMYVDTLMERIIVEYDPFGVYIQEYETEVEIVCELLE